MPVKQKPGINISELEKQIHDMVNNERRKKGLSALSWNEKLGEIARRHSRDMSARNYFAHESPEGYDLSYRYRKDGFECRIYAGKTILPGAENIFMNNLYESVVYVKGEPFYRWNSQEKIALTTVQGWMKSQGHRENILTPFWRTEGIGVFISEEGKIFITENFC